MFPKEIEVILARHLASCLAMPIFIVDEKGDLVFYNEPAELILGQRFEEAGEVKIDEWTQIIITTDLEGQELPYEKRPLIMALQNHQPSSREIILNAFDNIPRHISITAIPIIGQADRFLGAIAIFWEIEPTDH
jgi:PAS domain-containing protein